MDEVFATKSSLYSDGGLVMLNTDVDVNVLLPRSEIRFPSDDNFEDEFRENSDSDLQL